MKHFECVGIPFDDEKATSTRLSHLAANGDAEERSDGGRLITWIDDSSGAVMIFNTDREGFVVCARPAFQVGADYQGVAVGFGSDPDGCEFCDPLIATQPIPGSDASPPHVFHLGNSGLVRGQITPGGAVDLIVTGFAEEIRSWRDESEYREQPGNADAHTHMTGFVHDPSSPSPSQYLVTGTVVDVEKRRNSATGLDFWWLWVDAAFGAQGCWSVVAREEDLPRGAKRDNVVEMWLWACGMLIG
jgi:hypothetical protein